MTNDAAEPSLTVTKVLVAVPLTVNPLTATRERLRETSTIPTDGNRANAKQQIVHLRHSH